VVYQDGLVQVVLVVGLVHQVLVEHQVKVVSQVHQAHQASVDSVAHQEHQVYQVLVVIPVYQDGQA
jgi:hypothetical protein